MTARCLKNNIHKIPYFKNIDNWPTIFCDYDPINIKKCNVYVQEVYDIIQELHLHKFFQSYNPSDECGFMFSASHPCINKIIQHPKFNNDHSGLSFAITLRHIQYIEQQGFRNYVKNILI